MFGHWRKYWHILVTGPHRSGTTLTATAIHHDLGGSHSLVLEEAALFDQVHADYWLRQKRTRVVVQAPFMASICHQYPDVLVVFMVRDVDDIEASQRRARNHNGRPVPWHRIELAERIRMNASDLGASAARMKYDAWKDQRERLPHAIELPYKTLALHPLWQPAELRRDFHVRQTRTDADLADADLAELMFRDRMDALEALAANDLRLAVIAAKERLHAVG